MTEVKPVSLPEGYSLYEATLPELDREIGEGILEWIQVSGDYRRRGLGSYLVFIVNADFAAMTYGMF